MNSEHLECANHRPAYYKILRLFHRHYVEKKSTAFGHLELKSSHNSSPDHNSFCVRYSAKSHFTLSERVLWDLNIVFFLVFWHYLSFLQRH